MKGRENLRKERIQESSSSPELLQTAGELPSCRECGGIPYLSYVRCSCRCAPPRCQSCICVSAVLRDLHIADHCDAVLFVDSKRALPLCDLLPAWTFFTPGRRWEELRCLQHSHIGCMCPWPCKVLYLRVTDRQLAEARLALREVCERVSDAPSGALNKW